MIFGRLELFKQFRSVFVLFVLQDYGEFVTADAVYRAMVENIAENLAAVFEVFVAHVVSECIVDNLQVVHVAFDNGEFDFVLGLDLVVDQFAFGLECRCASDTCERILVGDELRVLEIFPQSQSGFFEAVLDFDVDNTDDK